MAALFGPGGPIILPWTVRGNHFRERDCPRRDSTTLDQPNSRSEFEMSARKQPAVHVTDFSDINWSSQPAALHHRHGSNIRLSKNNTVAERVNPQFPLGAFQNGVVMTAKSVPVGAVFQATVLEKVDQWEGSLVSVVIHLREHLSLVQLRCSVEHLPCAQN